MAKYIANQQIYSTIDVICTMVCHELTKHPSKYFKVSQRNLMCSEKLVQQSKTAKQ